jgi:hypothetical protein
MKEATSQGVVAGDSGRTRRWTRKNLWYVPRCFSVTASSSSLRGAAGFSSFPPSHSLFLPLSLSNPLLDGVEHEYSRSRLKSFDG